MKKCLKGVIEGIRNILRTRKWKYIACKGVELFVSQWLKEAR